MASGKAKNHSKLSLRNPKNKGKPLGPNNTKRKKEKKKKQRVNNQNPIEDKASNQNTQNSNNNNSLSNATKAQPASASAQLSFFLDQFQSGNGVKISSLELESVNGTISFFIFIWVRFSYYYVIMYSVWLVRKFGIVLATTYKKKGTWRMQCYRWRSILWIYNRFVVTVNCLCCRISLFFSNLYSSDKNVR